MDPEQQPTASDLRAFSRKVQYVRSRFDSTRIADDLAQSSGSDRQLVALEAMEELRVADEELRQQQEELVASRDILDAERQKYYELFDFAPDAYVVTDTLGIIREANAAASQLLGVPRQFLNGKPISLFFEEGARG